MKKTLLVAAACVIAFSACDNGKQDKAMLMQNDSLRSIIEARDNEINDMMGTLNEIQEGFRVISEAENRVTLAKSGEAGADKVSLIKQNMQFISQRMDENRELIKKLQQQLRETGFKGDQLKKTLDQMMAQLAQKDKDLAQLRTELEKKSIHIESLGKTIRNLNVENENLNIEKENLTNEKENLTAENEQKDQTINTQDKQLNTAWYVFGTKKELKAHNILNSGDVLRGSFDKSYFTKIDIRVDKEIKLYSKNVSILTAHPSSSYLLQKDTNGQYVLRIVDPNTFWSTSKYLVVQVK